MELRSLSYLTDLAFARFDGVVENKGRYVVIRTPDNPGYFWGNYVIFPEPPQSLIVLDEYKAIFKREFADTAGIRHVTLAWEGGQAAAVVEKKLEADLFIVEKSVILATDMVHLPAKSNHAVEIRTIKTDSEWEDVICSQIACRQKDFELEKYERFKRRQFSRYRKMTEAGLGAWFGAFSNGQLAGDLGVFKAGNLGRFQSVETLPEFRRQGICGSLVFHASQWAQKELGVKTLVMAADPEYHAARIYESVGFNPAEFVWGAYWYPREEWT